MLHIFFPEKKGHFALLMFNLTILQAPLYLLYSPPQKIKKCRHWNSYGAER